MTTSRDTVITERLETPRLVLHTEVDGDRGPRSSAAGRRPPRPQTANEWSLAVAQLGVFGPA